MNKFLYKFIKVFLAISILLLSSACSIDSNTTSYVKKESKDVGIEILPKMELLAGVLSQSIWMDKRGPEGDGNIYYQELKSFFDDYKDHEAMQIATELTKRGFTYDAPIQFMINLSELPELEKQNEYSEYLINRAGDEKILEDFRLALIDLEKESNFKEEFYDLHKEDYERYIDNFSKEVDTEEILAWMENFYGYLENEHKIVLAPAMFPSGGYGPTVEKEDGGKIVYAIIRESGKGAGEPEFSFNYTDGINLRYLILHEWGHSYVNPVVFEQEEYIESNNLSRILEPFTKGEVNITYLEGFLNEQILRGITGYSVKEIYDEEEYRKLLEFENKSGYYLTEYTVELIEYYQDNRDKYPTFDDFIPYLLQKYSEYQVDSL